MTDLLLLILAAYRLTSLIASEEGPFGLFERLRAALGAYDYGPDGRPLTNLGRGIVCPLCVGVYVAALMFALAQWGGEIGAVVLLWLAVAGGQHWLERSQRE
jgi:hypothetical protein